jgi:hypothetical protein
MVDPDPAEELPPPEDAAGPDPVAPVPCELPLLDVGPEPAGFGPVAADPPEVLVPPAVDAWPPLPDATPDPPLTTLPSCACTTAEWANRFPQPAANTRTSASAM